MSRQRSPWSRLNRWDHNNVQLFHFFLFVGFVSTRGADGSSKTFCDVVLEGLAPDGGLYVINDRPPHMSKEQWNRLVNLKYADRALRILEQWISPNHLTPSVLERMTQEAYNFDTFDCSKVGIKLLLFYL